MVKLANKSVTRQFIHVRKVVEARFGRPELLYTYSPPTSSRTSTDLSQRSRYGEVDHRRQHCQSRPGVVLCAVVCWACNGLDSPTTGSSLLESVAGCSKSWPMMIGMLGLIIDIVPHRPPTIDHPQAQWLRGPASAETRISCCEKTQTREVTL